MEANRFRKIVLKISLLVFIIFGNQPIVNAQLPTNGVYPGGLVLTSYVPTKTVANYILQTWDIDSILDSGTPVVLRIFANWCAPNWQVHQHRNYDSLFNAVGYGGTGEIAIFGIEADRGTTADQLEGGGSSLGDWITGTLYPMTNHDNVWNMFNIRWYPEIIMICPDRIVKEVRWSPINKPGGWIYNLSTIEDFKNYATNCGGLASKLNDPRIIANNSEETAIICGSNNGFEAKIVIQNYSTAAINGHYNIEVYDRSK